MIKYSLHNYHLTNQLFNLNKIKNQYIINYNLNNLMKQTITSNNFNNYKALLKRI